MKIKVYDIKQLNKSTIISFVGSGVFHKTNIILNMLNDWFNCKNEESSYISFNKPNTKITVFTNQLKLIVDYFSNTYIKAQLYNSYDRLEQFIENKKLEYELNNNLEREILLLDGDIHALEKRNLLYSKYKYLIDNYKKFNLTIILCGYGPNHFLLSNTKYFLFIESTDFFYPKIYKTFYSSNYSYDDFKSIFNNLTRNNGIIICKNNVHFYKDIPILYPVCTIDKVKTIRDRYKEILIQKQNASFSDDIIFLV